MSDSADVLLLGASMAGVELWYRLRKSVAGRELSLLVVDRQEEHPYIPLVHERMSRRLEESSTLPTREWMEKDPRLTWITGEVVHFDPERLEATLASGRKLRGRYVVVALGSSIAPPPGLPGAEHLLHFKLADESERASDGVARALERPDPHFVVIGGGISGVELAGELAHLRREGASIRVSLVHAGERLLPHLGSHAARLARRSLERQGVSLRLATRVDAVHEGEIVLAGGERMAYDAGFWAGGVRAPEVLASLGLPRTRGGWLEAAPTLQCAPNVFACGDDCRIVEDGVVWPTMQRAIECIWQAGTLCRNLLACERGLPLTRHVLHEDFFYGISLGADSVITYGPFALELGGLAVWFRRFLMRQYLARYRRSSARLLRAGPRALPRDESRAPAADQTSE